MKTMTAFIEWISGFSKGQRQSLDDLPAPSVQAQGIGGSGHGQYNIYEDETMTSEKKQAAKPPYRVPLMAEIRKSPWLGVKVATTFAGGGGSSTGYKLAGFDVVWANEFVPSAQETYRANHPGTILDPRDIKLVQPEEILAATGLKVGELDVFDGSPPCQAFSTAGKREKGWGQAKKYDHGAEQLNETLFHEYIRLLKGLQPKVFVAENVKGLTIGAAKHLMGDEQTSLLGGHELSWKDGDGKTVTTTLTADEDTILHGLMDAGHPDFGDGYVVHWEVLNAANLGVPQTRNRVIFVGVRKDLARKHNLLPCFPKPLPYVYTVRDALPELLGRIAVGNERFEPVFGETNVPSPTITASGARTSGLVEVPGTERELKPDGSRGFDPKYVDAGAAPSVTIQGKPRPEAGELRILSEDTSGLFSQGLGHHKMKDVTDTPHHPVATNPLKVQVLTEEHAKAVVNMQDKLMLEKADPRAQENVRIVQQQGGAYNQELSLDKPVPAVCSSQHSQFVLHEGPKIVHDNGRQKESGKPYMPKDVTDTPANTVRAGGGGRSHFYYVEGAERKDPATGQSLELDASRGKVCDGTQPFGSAGDAAVADEPSPTVLTPSNSVVLKQERRKFTIAELKRICAFPDDYDLRGTYGQQWERCGNSVPPVMMQHIAGAIRDGILAKVCDLTPRPRPEPPAAAPEAPQAPAKPKGRAKPSPKPADAPEPVREPARAKTSADLVDQDEKWRNWRPS